MLQLCPTLHDTVDHSRSGSSVHGVSRQEYWDGLPCLLQWTLPGMEPTSPALQVDSLPQSHWGSPRLLRLLPHVQDSASPRSLLEIQTRHQKHRQQSKDRQFEAHETKSSCATEETISKMERQPTEWEKEFINHVSDKGLIFKIHEELPQLNSRRPPNNLSLKWAKEVNRHFSKKTYKWLIGTQKDAQHHESLGKRKSKP